MAYEIISYKRLKGKWVREGSVSGLGRHSGRWDTEHRTLETAQMHARKLRETFVEDCQYRIEQDGYELHHGQVVVVADWNRYENHGAFHTEQNLPPIDDLTGWRLAAYNRGVRIAQAAIRRDKDWKPVT